MLPWDSQTSAGGRLTRSNIGCQPHLRSLLWSEMHTPYNRGSHPLDPAPAEARLMKRGSLSCIQISGAAWTCSLCKGKGSTSSIQSRSRHVDPLVESGPPPAHGAPQRGVIRRSAARSTRQAVEEASLDTYHARPPRFAREKKCSRACIFNSLSFYENNLSICESVPEKKKKFPHSGLEPESLG